VYGEEINIEIDEEDPAEANPAEQQLNDSDQ